MGDEGVPGDPIASTPRGADVHLLGRHHERRSLDDLLMTVRSDHSAVLVLRGETGIGRSTLLDHVADNAPGFRVARIAGVEAETELAFAGLHRLCAPLLDRLDRLPAPQRHALSTAFGLVTGRPADRFLIALAAFGLLADAAEAAPLVCLVDDVQWLDPASAQALGFIARRLLTESIGMVFAVRGVVAEPSLTGLPELLVEGLSEADAQLLLATVLPVPVDERVRDRIVAEARGNPLALRELPSGLASGELSYGRGMIGAAAPAGRIEQGYLRRIAALPAATRRLLLVAALEPVGDAMLVWQAARRLDIPAEATAAATAAGLIEITSRVRFPHPLVRSAVCRSAGADEFREAHGVLAEITDARRDPDRRTWHRAHAVPGPDDSIAAELERSLGRARARGGAGAAAAFLGRAAELSSDPVRAAGLALEAAEARHQAGSFEAALALLAVAEAGPLGSRQRAQAELVRARATSAATHASRAAGLLVAAARRLEPLDPETARDTYLEALDAGFRTARLTAGTGPADVARAARGAPRRRPPRAADLLLDGWAAVLTQGYRSGARVLQRAVAEFCRDPCGPQLLPVLPTASAAAMDLLDDRAWELLATRHLRLARELGRLGQLPPALHSRVLLHVGQGELGAAAALLAESRTVAEVTGARLWPYGAVVLAAFGGRDAGDGQLARAELNRLVAAGQGAAVTVLNWADAVLANGRGRYREAVTAATRATADPTELGQRTPALVELIEAASRDDRDDVARGALEELSVLTRASGTDWAAGLEARSRALVSGDDTAESCYREATERLGRTLMRVDCARAHLVYGEWLRRQNRRLDAREQLRIAHQLFTTTGVQAFAERARRELTATGLTVRKRTEQNTTQLTDHETQIVRLVGNGLTNPEIGAELFISPRTVEWHLRKVFGKLGVTSRRQLGVALRE
jgi:DNA-binding CsgD family transcriptional regulator